ncbi:DUF4156 domain-containing protein [Hydrogenovibrio marinus]|uniref:DUF4156 domain-containing protein n=1 Tax=Hydrogenovibrio marinus TaxID=28885 RepID=A0A066ZY46_HYDMR|nr:DUF4156 domain-containing protein [Hydrogenovibrio marinus]KDN95271.1 hypothetical protein EI16_02905 [Hydrogenovibrio marinus]BBN59749.1 hypothetical protein HVMH_1343 [Hydrogenovibrio marinus]
MKRRLLFSAVVAAVVSLSACSFVQTTKEGAQVTLVKEFNVKDCKKLGSTTTSVADKIGIIKRDPETMQKELADLARNTAAKMGGDSIVATSPLKDGTMTFDIYKCKP